MVVLWSGTRSAYQLFPGKTFEYLAEKHNLHFYTNGQNIHLLTEKQFLTPAFK
jgi:hypothetical protein